MRQFVLSAAALLTAGTLASAQSSGSVEVRYVGEGMGQYITVTSPVVHGSVNFLVGQFRHEFRNGSGEGSFLTGEQITFCINFGQDAGGGWQTFDVRPLADSPEPGPAMGNFAAQAIADVWAAAGGQQFTDANWAAAMQMILWDIIADYDGSSPSSVDISTGSMRFSTLASYFPTVTQHFNTLRDAIGTNAPLEGLRGLTHPEFQDQLVLVPAPGSVLLAAFGAAAALGRRRRR